jgi:hypothetical protein
MSYTFGDNHEASRRLHRLAEVFKPETRALLSSVGSVFDGRFELGRQQIAHKTLPFRFDSFASKGTR